LGCSVSLLVVVSWVETSELFSLKFLEVGLSYLLSSIAILMDSTRPHAKLLTLPHSFAEALCVFGVMSLNHINWLITTLTEITLHDFLHFIVSLV
jgi:hypothetical protein